MMTSMSTVGLLVLFLAVSCGHGRTNLHSTVATHTDERNTFIYKHKQPNMARVSEPTNIKHNIDFPRGMHNASCPPRKNQETPFLDLNTGRYCVWQQLSKASFIKEYHEIQKRLSGHGSALVNEGLEIACNGTTNPMSVVNQIKQCLIKLKDKGIKKIIYLGDSVMDQQVFAMSVLQKPEQQIIKKYEYIPARAQEGSSTVENAIKKAFQVASISKSVLVVNFGLHYQASFHMTGKAALFAAVQLLLNTWKQMREETRPILIWREGTPLQYPYSQNGWWNKEKHALCQAQKNCCPCVAVTEAMRKGFITEESSNAPDGDLYPAEAVEASITPLLAEHGVPISYVYNALAARHDLHRGHIRPDCTHFGMDGVMYLNEQVLKTAAKVIEKVP